jgi:peptidoglycan/xylan/chitin deacetylase (PgdA/CDA1 family)
LNETPPVPALLQRWPHRRRLLAALALALACCSALALRQVAKARTWQAFGELTARVDLQEKVVALTFDDGPSERGLAAVLPVLEQRGIKATFFLIGRTLERDPSLGSRLVRAEHEIGNHTYQHKPMLFRSLASMADEVERTDALIRRIGFRGPIHFRPPGGRKLLGLPWYLAATHRRTIMWDVDPESYVEAASDLVAYTREHVRPGSIIILHPMTRPGDETRAALPALVDGLIADGYRFVTVTELLALAERGESAQPR